MRGLRTSIGMLACGIALGLAPAHAASECGANVLGTSTGNIPVQGVGMVAGINGTPGQNQPGQSCTFTAGAGPHGYISSNAAFRIFIDTNMNQRLEAARGEEVLAETGDPQAGSLTIPTGAPVTVQILGVCSDAGCGYLGFVVAQ